MFDGPRILSRPWVIHWAGWKTDTYRLQQSGWSLSAQQDINYGSLRIAMKHEQCQLYGLTNIIDHDYYENIRDPHDTPRQELHVVHMASRFTVNIHETLSATAFSPIDAKPCIASRKIVTLDDLAHFAPPLVRTKEIILPEMEVPELLEMILKKQQPERTARLKAELAADREGSTRTPQQKFHAQIVSIAA